ncbi:hypothetical protein [Actinomadura macra]|uniref:hypothetical protein n=1 Tax=Actinomadura macra TaxID=46164 RepID=UPI00082F7958|nr:hypothetical protein [Actinomadura macra]
MTSYEGLRDAVVANEGIFQATMAELKAIKGAGRLGVHVRDAISRELASHGMGHLPAQLPPNQEDEVRLFLLGSAVADIVNAVLHPSDRGDRSLRRLGTSRADELLQQIRELVCE